MIGHYNYLFRRIHWMKKDMENIVIIVRLLIISPPLFFIFNCLLALECFIFIRNYIQKPWNIMNKHIELKEVFMVKLLFSITQLIILSEIFFK